MGLSVSQARQLVIYYVTRTKIHEKNEKKKVQKKKHKNTDQGKHTKNIQKTPSVTTF